MPASQTSLVGSILERKPQSKPSAPTFRADVLGKTGFPSVQHRSKSAFARAREEQKKGEPSRRQIVPVVHPAMKVEIPAPRVMTQPSSGGSGDWRKQVEEENLRRVEAMTEEEREQERREILEKFGPDVGEILRKAREARLRREKEFAGVEDGREEIPLVSSPPRSPTLSSDGKLNVSVTQSRADTSIRTGIPAFKSSPVSYV